MPSDRTLDARADWAASLSRQRQRLRTPSTAERAADLIRAQILDGELRPGVQLAEESLVEALGVSRNTVRESLQILGHERLVEHRRHRGAFVRRLSRDELADLCGLRRALEVGAVREAAARDERPAPGLVAAVTDAAEQGARSVAARDWVATGTANSRFHIGLAGLPDNPRIDAAVRSLLAELRLAFLVVADARAMHERYVPEHGALAGLVSAGQLDDAASRLEDYLHRSEHHLITSYSAAVETIT